MNHRDLLWRGVFGRELGVIVTEPVAYKRPALRRETITVPGRSGVLTIKQDDAYETVTYAPALAILPGADKRAVYDWLRGSGRVVFGSMPDVEYEATIVGQMDCTELIPGHPAWYETLIATWECQPWQYPIVSASDIEFTGDADYALARWNPGNVASAPLISAVVTPGTVLTLRISGNEECVLTAPDGEADEMTVLLDCDAESAYTLDGVSLDASMVGEYPVIPPGSWTASCSAENGTLIKLTIQPRWRSV